MEPIAPTLERVNATLEASYGTMARSERCVVESKELVRRSKALVLAPGGETDQGNHPWSPGSLTPPEGKPSGGRGGFRRCKTDPKKTVRRHPRSPSEDGRENVTRCR